MKNPAPVPQSPRAGFSLLEMLVTVAIIGTIAILVVPSISSMRGGSAVQIARQQQAELQTALGAWVASASGGSGGLAAARGTYNGAGNKLSLLQSYLQPSTYAMFSGGSGGVTSKALEEAGATLQFSAWGVDNMPSVNWVGGQ